MEQAGTVDPLPPHTSLLRENDRILDISLTDLNHLEETDFSSFLSHVQHHPHLQAFHVTDDESLSLFDPENDDDDDDDDRNDQLVVDRLIRVIRHLPHQVNQVELFSLELVPPLLDRIFVELSRMPRGLTLLNVFANRSKSRPLAAAVTRGAVELIARKNVNIMMGTTCPSEELQELNRLGISSCRIDNDGFAEILQAIFSRTLYDSSQPVKPFELLLSDCGINQRMDVSAFTLLESPQSCRLVTLNLHLNSNPLGDGGAALLAGVLTSSEGLRELHVDRCGITAVGCASLCVALRDANNSLEVFSLGGNAIRDQGAAHVASMLEKNTSLHTLDVRTTSLTPLGVQTVLNALQSNHSLRSLNLFLNDSPTASTIEVFRRVVMSRNFSLYELLVTSDGQNGDNMQGMVYSPCPEYLVENRVLQRIGRQFNCINSVRCTAGQAGDDDEGQDNDKSRVKDLLSLLHSDRELVKLTSLYWLTRNRPQAMLGRHSRLEEGDQADKTVRVDGFKVLTRSSVRRRVSRVGVLLKKLFCLWKPPLDDECHSLSGTTTERTT